MMSRVAANKEEKRLKSIFISEELLNYQSRSLMGLYSSSGSISRTENSIPRTRPEGITIRSRVPVGRIWYRGCPRGGSVVPALPLRGSDRNDLSGQRKRKSSGLGRQGQEEEVRTIACKLDCPHPREFHSKQVPRPPETFCGTGVHLWKIDRNTVCRYENIILPDTGGPSSLEISAMAKMSTHMFCYF